MSQGKTPAAAAVVDESVVAFNKIASNPSKNPLEVFTAWTPSTLKLIDITVSTPEETTTAFTKIAKPATRYWKSPVRFKYKNWTSESLHVLSINIPYVVKKNYGVTFAYGDISTHIRDAIHNAVVGKGFKVDMAEERVLSNSEQWWKVLNKMNDSVGTLDSSAEFMPRALDTILDKTHQGVTVNAILRFNLKYHTEDGSGWYAGCTHRIGVDVDRAFIKMVNRDVAPPVILPHTGGPVTSNTTATSADIADDSVMKLLASLQI